MMDSLRFVYSVRAQTYPLRSAPEALSEFRSSGQALTPGKILYSSGIVAGSGVTFTLRSRIFFAPDL